MTDVQTAEALWARAHEHVRRGDFASAVRDLATCFQMLQALNDPRVYEVHKRWTEVHQMYLEEGARPEQPPAAQASTPEALAEAAANAGDLDTAIELYTRIAAQNPHNELARERLAELTQARRRADDLVRGVAPTATASSSSSRSPSSSLDTSASTPTSTQASTPTSTSSPPAAPSVHTSSSIGTASPSVGAAPSPSTSASSATPATSATSATPSSSASADDWSDLLVDEESPPRPAAPAAAPAMAVDDAPLGMQSLDVAFSVGDTIDSSIADELPVEGYATGLPAAAQPSVPEASPALPKVPSTITKAVASVREDEELDDRAQGAGSEVAFLEELLARVQANRRRAS